MLAELAAEVVTIERIPELADDARAALAEAGYANVEVRVGDGSLGVPERAPFDAIAVAAAAPTVPPALYDAARRRRPSRRPSRLALGPGARARRADAGRPGRAHVDPLSLRPARSATKGLAMTDRMGDGDDAVRDYPAMTVESSPAQIDAGFSPARVRAGMRKRKNWEQLVKFCVVGATGYVVNLAVFTLARCTSLGVPLHPGRRRLVPRRGDEQLHLESPLDVPRRSAATSRTRAMRFLVVSTLALVANLVVLHVLVTLGLGEVVAQAIAIVLVTPVNFVGNKLWSFGPRR